MLNILHPVTMQTYQMTVAVYPINAGGSGLPHGEPVHASAESE